MAIFGAAACELVGGIEARHLLAASGGASSGGATVGGASAGGNPTGGTSAGSSGSGGGAGAAGRGGEDAGSAGSSVCPPQADAGFGEMEPVALAAGGFHTCVLFFNGHVKCWGDNMYGQLGLGHTQTMGDDPCETGDAILGVELGATVETDLSVPMAAGTDHTCVILDTGKVKCWGYNHYGQLGIGDDLARGDDAGEMGSALPIVDLGMDYEAIALTAGDGHTCALLADGSAKCWGQYNYAQIGFVAPHHVGDDPGEMGEALSPIDPGAPLRLDTRTTIVAGSTHTCAILESFQIKCWGDNLFGKIALGDASAYPTLLEPELADLLPIDLGPETSIHDLALGHDHTCAHMGNRRIACFGDNRYGQLGIGDTEPRGDQIEELGESLPTSLVSADPNVRPRLIASGWDHTCIILEGLDENYPEDGQLKCWGHNSRGELGLGHAENYGDETDETIAALPTVPLGERALQVATGASHTCALLGGNRVKCWGAAGQLGLGLETLENLGDDPGEIEQLPDLDFGTPASLR